MGDRPTDALEPSAKKGKRTADRGITQGDLDRASDEEEEGEEQGSFQRASEATLSTRRILKAKRPPPRAADAVAASPFAGISLVAPPAPTPVAPVSIPEETAVPAVPAEGADASTEDAANEEGKKVSEEAKPAAADENKPAADTDKLASPAPSPTTAATGTIPTAIGSVPSTFSGLFGQKDSSASVPVVAVPVTFGILGGGAPAFSFRPAQSEMWSGGGFGAISGAGFGQLASKANGESTTAPAAGSTPAFSFGGGFPSLDSVFGAGGTGTSASIFGSAARGAETG
eukprot:CAMPEP_0198213190 /NCGR_PEP_ID=MMETSP1445-20131203/28726_1 /TAXON_ID=36898 /ORGANISM="Pyramimonas sp., Strain CCMP2087" /LENGTH=285 /DNA_ID=CAMNT_0043887801 /DNA_START=110 /DNA_END=963 /DNA_ORIENTATION=+